MDYKFAGSQTQFYIRRPDPFKFIRIIAMWPMYEGMTMQKETQLDKLLMRLLTSVPLFADLNRAELLTLLYISKKTEFPAERFLFREGEEGDSLFVVISGEVEISKTTPKGTLVTIAEARPGDVIGDMALIEKLPRNASACAKTPAVALEMSYQALKSQSRLELALLRNMARLLARRLRTANEALRDAAEKNVSLPEDIEKDLAKQEPIVEPTLSPTE